MSKAQTVLHALLAGLPVQLNRCHSHCSVRLFQAGETITTPSEEVILLDPYWLGLAVVQVTDPGKSLTTSYVRADFSFTDVLNAASEMSDDAIARLSANLTRN